MKNLTKALTFLVTLGCQTAMAHHDSSLESYYDTEQMSCVDEDICMGPGRVSVITLGTPTIISMTTLEAAILDEAVKCSRAKANHRLPDEVLLRLLRMEEEVGMPHSLRGFILASACSESGFWTQAEGDHAYSSAGKPKSVGIVQMWPWWEDRYGIDRRDPYQAAEAYLKETARQTELARDRCGFQGSKAWVVGQARAARGAISKGYLRQLRKLPLREKERIEIDYDLDSLDHVSRAQAVQIGKAELPREAIMYAERCYDQTGHYRRLKRWRKAWKRHPEYLALLQM